MSNSVVVLLQIRGRIEDVLEAKQHEIGQLQAALQILGSQYRGMYQEVASILKEHGLPVEHLEFMPQQIL